MLPSRCGPVRRHRFKLSYMLSRRTGAIVLAAPLPGVQVLAQVHAPIPHVPEHLVQRDQLAMHRSTETEPETDKFRGMVMSIQPVGQEQWWW